MASRPLARCAGEEHDQYARIVLRWDYPDGHACRIIESRCGLQWIVQRRKGTRYGEPIWRNRHFCRHRASLERILKGHAEEIAGRLPEWI